MYVSWMKELWYTVARTPNAAQPPATKQIEYHEFFLNYHGYTLEFHLNQQEAVSWTWGHLFDTMSAIMDFGTTFQMAEMGFEITAAGTSFTGFLQKSGPRTSKS